MSDRSEDHRRPMSTPGTKARATLKQLMARWGWFGVALDGAAVVHNVNGEERWVRVSGQGESSTWELEPLSLQGRSP